MVACSEALTAEDNAKGTFARTDPRAGDNNIPNGTTDSCWFGWQTMEERNPYGGSGSTDTPIKQYVWGTYIDECLQLNLLAVAGPQQLGIGVYYPLQDTLYRTMALANSSATTVEAYDTDAYGNTIIFTGPGPDNTWFTDDDTQSSYGANDIIYCGYRYDAETENYYVRNRYYSPILGRWLTRDPIGYRGGINLYDYVNSSPVGNVDAEGLATLPGVQAPVLLRTGEKHAMSGGRYYINYYYTQDLGVVVTSGESPQHLLLFKLTEEILHGLTKLSGIGEIIAKIANSITDNGDYTIPWKGSAFPEITTVYFCNGKVQSVTPKEWGHTRWEWDTSLHGQMGGGFIIKGWQGQDRQFFKSLVETTKELIKSAGGE